MDMPGFLVTLLVIGAPIALFLALRKPGRPAAGTGAAEGRAGHQPPADFGMAREAAPSGPGQAAAQAEAEAAGHAATSATAAAAGGALILAVGAARQRAGDGGESTHAGLDDGSGGGHGDGSGDGGGDGGGGGGGNGGGGGGD